MYVNTILFQQLLNVFLPFVLELNVFVPFVQELNVFVLFVQKLNVPEHRLFRS